MVLHYEINKFDRLRDPQGKKKELIKLTKAETVRKYYAILWQISCVLE